MSEERKQEIIAILQSIYDNFIPTEEEPELSMFGLISRYNQTGQNIELIGGDFAWENGFKLN
ncbi:MAG TPA: hypothetical protein DEA87_02955 [Candidatus Veblenbacteria bacterium]|nr:hypothetical protein [Candidatus Veblenbacteria bacterium]